MESKRLTISNLVKIYPARGAQEREVHAVDDVSIDIQPGEFVTLLGPSGCGKTTTLRMIAGFEKPTSGEIRLGDRAINALPPDKRDTAMVFQSYALFPNYNVYDNIAYGLKLRKLSKPDIDRRVREIIEMVGLTGMERRHTNQLSGGQQQRVALARALVIEPSLLLFDEPLSNLDAKLRLQMRTEIRKLQKAVGITSVYVTHDQSEAMSMSDRIVILKDGKIAQAGSPKDVYYHPASEFVASFIGTANFLSARIAAKHPNGTIDCEAMGTMLEGVEYGGSANVGDTCRIVIRPEACSIGREGMFPVQVKLSVFMGAYQYYEAEAGGETFLIHENNPKSKHIFEPDEQAYLSVCVSDIHAL
ncbi:MAG: ABC transporter ATP-binding protein [Clostridiales bacterium]|nr:ABC transporter ATP-binding protein [Clostridiales bacterium]